MREGFELGALVSYDHEGAALLGVIVSEKKEKWLVLNERDRELELPTGRLTRIGTQKISDKAKVLPTLRDIREKIEQHALPIRELWELIHADHDEISSDALSKMYFGDNCSVTEYALMYSTLIKDKIFFKRGKKVFIPRPESVVEDLLMQAKIKEEKLKEAESLVTFFKKKLSGEPCDESPYASSITLLFLAAAHSDCSSQEVKDVKDIMDVVAHHLGREVRDLSEASYQLLRDMKLLDQNTNLSVYRHRIPDAFTQTPPLPSTLSYSLERKRIDHEFVVTIDDEETKDIDDALSVSKKPYGYEIGIHITDVASRISKGDPYDAICRRRATSVYLPDKTIHMLPNTLSEELLSLIKGCERLCISVLIDVLFDGTMQNARVIPSILTVKERLSYREADARIASGDEYLNFLLSLTREREAQRISQGALKVSKVEIHPEITESGEIKLVESNETESARFLVGECMVLANSIFANFCISHDISIPFRSQEPLDESAKEEIEAHPEGQARDFALRVRLKRSSTCARPSPHATLGLQAYTQGTSPIRRYFDIIVQRQLLHYFAFNTPEYSLSDIETEIAEIESVLTPAHLVSRESRRFYLLRYLEDRTKKSRLITGTVVRTDGRFPLVELDEVYIAFPIKPEKKIELGDILTLEIISIDPKNDYIRLNVKQ